MEPVTFRRHSPQWTQWGFPPKRNVTCPRCSTVQPALRAEATSDDRPRNHPSPADPAVLCPGSPRVANQ